MTGGYELSGSESWERAAGWIGLVVAGVALAAAATLGLGEARNEREAGS